LALSHELKSDAIARSHQCCSCFPLVTIESKENEWSKLYQGNGHISFNSKQGITLEPKPPSTRGDTQSALVISTRTQQTPLRDFRISLVVTTEKQLRKTQPNSWEVFWLFFNYSPGPEGTKKTNYFILKPNGIELGTASGHKEQKYLFTHPKPQLVLGRPNEITLTKFGTHVKVAIDGSTVMDYKLEDPQNPLIDIPGWIGLYTEDARVRVQSVQIISLD
jgi:hypothetical protein